VRGYVGGFATWSSCLLDDLKWGIDVSKQKSYIRRNAALTSPIIIPFL